MKNQERKLNILEDVSASGKKRNWSVKKRKVDYLKAIYLYLKNEPKAERLDECSKILSFIRQGEVMKLKSANFCRVRLCPICTWRRSLKLYGQIDTIFNEINKRDIKYKYIYITLTIKNVDGIDLKKTIDKMMKAWNLFKEYSKIKRILKGSVRTFEVTVNHEDNTYHPHIHILALVPYSYFTNPNQYLSHVKYSTLWQKALKEKKYIPKVNVKKVKCYGDDLSAYALTKAILETAKYSVKESDYLLDDFILSKEIVEILDVSLANRRFIAYTGILKEIHKELNLTDVDSENANLINVSEDEEEPIVIVPEDEIIYVWNSGIGNYFKQ